MTISGLANESLDKMWKQVALHQVKLSETGEFQTKRSEQQVRWMWAMLEDRMRAMLHENESVQGLLQQVERSVENGELPASVAVENVINRLLTSLRTDQS